MSEAPRAAIRRGAKNASDIGKNGGNKGGIRHLTTFREAKLQSALGADNLRYATDFVQESQPNR